MSRKTKTAKAVSVVEKLYVLEQIGLFGGRCENYVLSVGSEVSANSGVTYTQDPSEAMIGIDDVLGVIADHLRDNGHAVILTPLCKVAA